VGLANLGSESETCVGSCVHLVGVSISFEENFYRLPFTPPLSGSPYRSFTSTTADGEDRSAEAREPTLPPQAGAVVELVLEEATLVEGMLHATTSSHHGG
jgi:hypothetical protein